MIEAHDLTVERGGRTILEGYNLRLEKGRTLAILGANGVGKTTLISVLTGLIQPRSGRLVVHGQVGFVPQLFEVSFAYSALDIALMGRARHLGLFGAPGRRDYEIVRHFLAMLGIEELSTHDRAVVARARRLERFLTQPFFTVGASAGTTGRLVSIAETLDGCEAILSETSFDRSESAYYMIGSLKELGEAAA